MKNLTIAALVTLYASVTLAAPVPDSADIVELESRQLGFLLRGAGKALKSLPEKAGKKMAKNGGGQENVVEGKRLKETTDRWTKYLGKEQDSKCVQGWMNKFSEQGGFNAAINCDKHRTNYLAPGYTGGYYPSAANFAGKPSSKPKPASPPKPKAKSPPRPKGKSEPKPQGRSASKSKSNGAPKPKNKNASKPKSKGGKKKREFLEDSLEE